MGDLSEHFSRGEFTCHCCGKFKVNPKLIDALEKLRELVSAPIIITSGYRCKKHNAAIGGATHSQHCLGNAADIHVESMTAYDLFKLADQVPDFKTGGRGLYVKRLRGADFVHVDVRARPTRWAQVRGKAVSITEAFSTESKGANENGKLESVS